VITREKAIEAIEGVAETLLHGSVVGSEEWRYRRVRPFLTPDSHRAIQGNQDRRHHIPKQRHRATNWAAYDTALRQRGSLTVWFTEAAIAAWKAVPRATRGGQCSRRCNSDPGRRSKSDPPTRLAPWQSEGAGWLEGRRHWRSGYCIGMAREYARSERNFQLAAETERAVRPVACRLPGSPEPFFDPLLSMPPHWRVRARWRGRCSPRPIPPSASGEGLPSTQSTQQPASHHGKVSERV
jgi:hypothetical protein